MRALIILASLCVAPVAAQSFDPENQKYFRETPVVALEGNVLFHWPEIRPRQRDAIAAMVCGLNSPNSFLSLRAWPDSGSKELMRLPPFATLALNGTTTADGAWAKVESYAIKADAKGRTIPDGPLANTPASGWVSTRYICHFTH